MKRSSADLLRASRVCCALSLPLATCAFAATGGKLAFSDITKPDFFPILPWSPYHGWSKPFIEHRPNGLESIADCHFNMAGFVWRQGPSALRETRARRHPPARGRRRGLPRLPARMEEALG